MNCFVCFKEVDAASNGQDIGGTNEKGDGDGDANRTNLIVNYLPQYMTDKDLYTLFVSQGPIDNVRIMKDYKVSNTL